MDIKLKQAQALVGAFGGDEDLELTLVIGDDAFSEGKGLYVHDEYTEHGSIFLGD